MFHFEIPYLTLLVLLSIYGAQRLWLVVELFARLKLGRVNRPSSHSNSLDAARDSEAVDTVLESSVLLQLPVFNDGNVFLRLLDSVRELDWPHDRLLVQVLDDSTDGSSDQIADRVAVLRDTGLRVEHLRRPARVGYKAGALADGLAKCDFPFVAMFDSDFVIPSDFLRRALVEFADERVAFVQGRWGFANESDSFLTKVQALMLDGHFAIEHRVRALAGRFFNFNGTAGVWRRAAIDDAGGWTSDSITEDLDLSLRAWLAGWEFCYLDDLIAMSDLPVRMSAYRTQQNRWISGSIQTAMTYLPKILSSPVSYTRRLDLLLAITDRCAGFCTPSRDRNSTGTARRPASLCGSSVFSLRDRIGGSLLLVCSRQPNDARHSGEDPGLDGPRYGNDAAQFEGGPQRGHRICACLREDAEGGWWWNDLFHSERGAPVARSGNAPLLALHRVLRRSCGSLLSPADRTARPRVWARIAGSETTQGALKPPGRNRRLACGSRVPTLVWWTCQRSASA